MKHRLLFLCLLLLRLLKYLKIRFVIPSVILAGAADKFNQNEIQLTITHKVDGLKVFFVNVLKFEKNGQLTNRFGINNE